MLFSHHSHSLLHEYVSTGNEVELEKKSWRLQRQTHGASPSSFLFILSCTDSLSWAVRVITLTDGLCCRFNMLSWPRKTHQQGPTRVDGCQRCRSHHKRKWSWIQNGDWLSVLHLSKPIHSLNRIADESRWHLFTLTVMLRSEVLLAASPPPPLLMGAPLDKGSLCLRGLWFLWADGRCCLANKPCTHNLQTGQEEGWEITAYYPLLSVSDSQQTASRLSDAVITFRGRKGEGGLFSLQWITSKTKEWWRKLWWRQSKLCFFVSQVGCSNVTSELFFSCSVCQIDFHLIALLLNLSHKRFFF